MTEERKQVLEMLAQGKISVQEAEQLLGAVGEPSPDVPKTQPKYLRVLVEGGGSDRESKVNVRIPMQLLRAGVKLAALIPTAAQGPINKALHEQGIDLDVSKIKASDLEEIIESLSDMTVDVDSQSDGKVRVFCE